MLWISHCCTKFHVSIFMHLPFLSDVVHTQCIVYNKLYITVNVYWTLSLYDMWCVRIPYVDMSMPIPIVPWECLFSCGIFEIVLFTKFVCISPQYASSHCSLLWYEKGIICQQLSGIKLWWTLPFNKVLCIKVFRLLNCMSYSGFFQKRKCLHLMPIFCTSPNSLTLFHVLVYCG